MPAPFAVSPKPVPETMPLSVSVVPVATDTEELLVRVTFGLKVKVPVVDRVPPPRVSVPLPRAVSLATCKVPAEMVVMPE